MQHPNGYTVELRGFRIQCADVNAVVEAVKALEPLMEAGEGVEAAPTRTDREVPLREGESTIAAAVREVLEKEQRARRPVEILKALRRKRIPGVTYNTVYSALRYRDDFEKDGGRWKLAEGAR